MAQEVKPIDNTLFGNNRSWRDEARYRLVQALGPKYGEILGEGLLGESEEDKYLEYLQRTYGSTLPRDEQGNISEEVPLNRPMGEAFTDMSDLGALDQTLMVLSGGSSLYPRTAATAAGVETGALLGDAEGELRKDNPLGAGIMGATALLPYGINRAFRGYRQAPTETIEETPLLSNPSRRQFNKGMGAGIATLGVMTSPLAPLLRRTGSTMAKLNPTKFLNKSKDFYRNLKKVPVTEEAKVSFLKTLNNPRPEDNLSNYSFQGKMNYLFKNDTPYTVKKITTDSDGVQQYDVITKKFDNVEPEDFYDASLDIQTDLARKHFKDYGLELDDTYLLSNHDFDTVYYSSESNTIYDELGKLNADKGSIKSYDIGNEFYVETYTVDGVPVVKTKAIESWGIEDETLFIPTQETLLKKAQ